MERDGNRDGEVVLRTFFFVLRWIEDHSLCFFASNL